MIKAKIYEFLQRAGGGCEPACTEREFRSGDAGDEPDLSTGYRAGK